MIRKSNISYMIDLHYRIHQVVHCNHMMLQYKVLLLYGQSLFLHDTDFRKRNKDFHNIEENTPIGWKFSEELNLSLDQPCNNCSTLLHFGKSVQLRKPDPRQFSVDLYHPKA